MAATQQCLPVVRASVRRWLAGLAWPDDPAEDIVLAVHEAVTNAVEHAYPDDVMGGASGVDVQGVLETDPSGTAWGVHLPGAGGARRVRVSVCDHGRWQPDRHDRTDPSRARGRGLTMMEALMAEMSITASAETGTQVELISEAECLHPAADVRPARPHGW